MIKIKHKCEKRVLYRNGMGSFYSRKIHFL
nr:MAG TPA: protein of unknown function (DUF5484) [Caudoviricetes sp.]